MFRLVRHQDPSGVSGTGAVGTVVEFDSGLTVLHWDTATPSIAVHTDSRQIEQLHGHDGATELVPMDSDRLLSAYRRLMPYLLQDGASIKPIVVGPHPDYPDRLRCVFHDEKSWRFWTALLDGSTDTASHVEVNGELRHRWIDPEGDIWLEWFGPVPGAYENDPYDPRD